LRLYLEGASFRRIGRLLSVNYQPVVNWINAYHARLTPARKVDPETVELDEWCNFIGTKKSPYT
jgi:hypothetical protein